MSEPRVILKEVTDPKQVARIRAQHARIRRNSDSLTFAGGVPHAETPEVDDGAEPAQFDQ